MSTLDWFERADRIIAQYISRNFTEALCEDCGLDRRSGYRIWVSPDAVAIPKQNDGSLQYYSGFEYVSKELRREYGDWVIYLAEDSRVQDCIDYYYEKQEEAADASDA
jgi:hypothetical protein